MARFKRANQAKDNEQMTGNMQDYAYVTGTGEFADKNDRNFGQSASRSLYSNFANMTGTEMTKRDLLSSRLWYGVPQLTDEQLSMFDAAYTGHTFIFVVNVPKFMTSGIYKGTNMHQQIRNLKAVIERASTSFDGASEITVNAAQQDDGNSQKVDHVTSVTKDQSTISIGLHEFAGLPVKNALESWVTGIQDYKSGHGGYHGNLGIPGGWSIANHTMSILVVQVNPSWTVVQDAAYYYNMVPTSVPFDHFSWQKREYGIVQDLNISFTCNEERSPMIMHVAERFMNNRVLSMVETSVFNQNQFVQDTFMAGEDKTLEVSGRESMLKSGVGEDTILDKYQFNIGVDSTDTDGGDIGKAYTSEFNNVITSGTKVNQSSFKEEEMNYNKYGK